MICANPTSQESAGDPLHGSNGRRARRPHSGNGKITADHRDGIRQRQPLRSIMPAAADRLLPRPQRGLRQFGQWSPHADSTAATMSAMSFGENERSSVSLGSAISAGVTCRGSSRAADVRSTGCTYSDSWVARSQRTANGGWGRCVEIELDQVSAPYTAATRAGRRCNPTPKDIMLQVRNQL